MSVLPPPFMPPLVGALALAIVVALLIRPFRLPYTVALAGAGMLVGLLGAAAFDSLDTEGALSANLILFVILPPLLFDGASKMDARALKQNWRAVLMLAVPSVIINTIVIGTIVWVIIWSADPSYFLYAILVGSILAPTDPVSVLATFKEAGAPHRLSTIVEGEALFNDGTGVVLFQVILALVLTEGQVGLSETLVSGVAQFLMVVLVGAGVGALTGMVANTTLDWTENHLLEVTVSVATAFGSFLLAEQFHGSGVIAVVVAGLVVGSIGKVERMTPQARVALDHFWEQIAFVINSVLFILIGFEIVQRMQTAGMRTIPLALTAIGAASLARLVVYPKLALSPKVGDHEVPKEWRHVIYVSGLRGSVSLALLLILAHLVHTGDFDHGIYDDIFLMVSSVVLFTLLIQGPIITPLIKRLGIAHGDDGRSEEWERAIATLVAERASLSEFDRLAAAGLVTAEGGMALRASARKRQDLAKTTLLNLASDPDFSQRLNARTEARLRAAAQRAVADAEIVGLVSGDVGGSVRWSIDTELALLLTSEAASGEIPMPYAKIPSSDPLLHLSEE